MNLLGIDSQNLALSKRQALWERLAGEWKLDNLEKITTEVGLEDLDEAVDAILKGETRGAHACEDRRGVSYTPKPRSRAHTTASAREWAFILL